MGLLWDDDTTTRAKKQNKETKWVWIMSLIFFGIVSVIILPEIHYPRIAMLTLSGALMIVSIYGYIYRTTHFRIPDTLNERKKNGTRLLFFIVGGLFFYMTWIVLLSEHYPVFKSFIGATFLIEHMKF